MDDEREVVAHFVRRSAGESDRPADVRRVPIRQTGSVCFLIE